MSTAHDRQKGPGFERDVADYLKKHLDDDRIDRRVKTGNKDRGDIGGVRVHLQRIVIEVKRVARLNLAGWTTEAEIERGNDDALAGIVVHKRVGYGRQKMHGQYVTLTLGDLVALINGNRDHLNGDQP